MPAPKYTVEKIRQELAGLGKTSAAAHYLRKELNRRSAAGRPRESSLSPKEQTRERVRNFRLRQKEK